VRRKKGVKELNSIIPYWRGPSISPGLIKRLLQSPVEVKDVLTCARNISEEIRVIDDVKIGKWKIRCPYCETSFEVDDNKIIRCPNCNNAIKKVNFEQWNSLLEQFMNFEISTNELNRSPVFPTDNNFELIVEDIENIPTEPINFRVSFYGFNRVYKFFSPLQLYTMSRLISKIRETDKGIRTILSISLLDYISYNSMFTLINDKGIKSMFYTIQPKISWKWPILPGKYFVNSTIAVLKVKEGIYIPTLNYGIQNEIYNFYLSILKITLSNLSNGVLVPYLYSEYFFNCLDDKCNSYVEKGKQKLTLEDILDNKTTFLMKIIKEDDIIFLLNSRYRVLSIQYEKEGFKISLDKNRNGTITIAAIHNLLKEKRVNNMQDIKALTSALEIVLKEFTKYEKIIGIRGIDEVFNEVTNVLCNSIGCKIADDMTRYYILGKFYGRSRLFFRMLFMLTSKRKIKFSEQDDNILGLLLRVKKDPSIVRTLPPSKIFELMQTIRILSNLEIKDRDIYKDILTKIDNEIGQF